MSIGLHVAGAAAHTAFGGIEETVAARRAGRRAAGALPLVGLGGVPLVAALAGPLGPPLEGARRVRALVVPMLERAVREAGAPEGPCALLLCAPLGWGTWSDACAPVLAPARHDWGEAARGLAASLAALGLSVPPELVRVVPRGHAAGVVALREAAALLEERRAAQVVVVGLDAHGERGTLERLDLLGWSGSSRARSGFLPGEASAALVLRPAAANEPGPQIRGWGDHTELEVPSCGDALTGAVRAALDVWGGDARGIGDVLVDLNGDARRAREWTFAATRTLGSEGARPAVEHPADRLGDVGAASIPLFLALAAERGAGATLVVASSRDGLRGAAVLVRAGSSEASR